MSSLKRSSCQDLFHTPKIEMRKAQSELVTALLRMHTERIVIEAELLERLSTQSPQFMGRTEHVLAWTTNCQTRMEQSTLLDEVTIQYAKQAMSE